MSRNTLVHKDSATVTVNVPFYSDDDMPFGVAKKIASLEPNAIRDISIEIPSDVIYLLKMAIIESLKE